MSLFEWDQRKADANWLKHKIDFSEAATAMLGLALTKPSKQPGEARLETICDCGGRIIVVVWTPREGAIRIISARVARRNEQASYYQNVSRSVEARPH